MYDMKTIMDLMSASKHLSDSDTIKLFVEYWDGKLEYEKLSDKLFRANIRFIFSVAKEYFNKTKVTESELVSEGITGFCEAIPKYEDVNINFRTYAVYWVKARISEYIEKNSYHCKLPHNKAQEFRKEYAKKRDIEKQNIERRKNGLEELEYVMPKDLEMLSNELNNCFSLDSKIDDSENTTFAEVIECQRAAESLSSYDMESMREFIRDRIDCLTPTEQVVIRVAFGFYEEEITFKELAQKINIRYSQIATIRDTAINKLRILMRDEMLV